MTKRKRTCKSYKMTRAGRRCASYGATKGQTARGGALYHLRQVRDLAGGWVDSGGEEGLIGRWIWDLLENAQYDELSPTETIQLLESSLEEVANVLAYVRNNYTYKGF